MIKKIIRDTFRNLAKQTMFAFLYLTVSSINSKLLAHGECMMEHSAGQYFMDANGPVLPQTSYIIENEQLRITFDSSDGLPIKYELRRVHDFFRGKDVNEKIEAIVRDVNSLTESRSVVSLDSVFELPGEIRFKYKVKFREVYAGSFEIKFALHNTTVFIYLENVVELEGYHLMEVITDNFLTIKEEDGPSSFVYNTQAGKLVDLAAARPGNIGDDIGAFGGYPNISVLPVVAFVQPKSVCTMEVNGFCNKTVLDVSDDQGNKRAKMGVCVPHYQRGGINTPDLIIKQNNICRIDFSGDYDGNGTIEWLDAAKMVRDYMPKIPTDFFDDKYMWIINGQVGRHTPEASFDDIFKLTRRISALIDNSPQICYISGWCEGGHDTGYPNVKKLNSLLGGEKAFFDFKKKAEKHYNTTVSFDDNYDDQYKNEYTTGFFDVDNIAKTIDGKLMTFNAWNGKDTSYITGMAHYMRNGGPGEARVDYTAKKYNLKGSLLIDAATWWTIRPDYDPAHPASAPTNLEGKYKLFDRFKKHGINVVSELLRYPAVGHLALVCDGPSSDGGNQYGGAGIDIPFLSIAYRNSIYYGSPGGNQNAANIRDVLYNNSLRHGWLKKNDPDSLIADIFYTNYIPWFKMHNLEVLSFKRDGETIDMTLSEKSSIHLSPGAVIAKYRDCIIVNNEDITCPIDDHRIAFYSKSNKDLSYQLSSKTPFSKVTAKRLYADYREEVPVSVENKLITVHVTKHVPIIVYIE